MANEELGPVESVHKLLSNHTLFREIVKGLTNEDRKIDFRGLNVEVFSMGAGPLSTLLRSDYKYYAGENGTKKEEKEYTSFIKYFKTRKTGLPEGFLDTREKYWDIEYEAYALCDGLDYTPHLYKDLKGRFLIFEYIPGQFLEKSLEEKRGDRDGREGLVKSVLEDVVARFHIDIGNRMLDVFRGEMDIRDFRKLITGFVKEENAVEKAVGYIRATKGLDTVEELCDLYKDLITRFRKHYPAIAKAYDKGSRANQISHGNLTPANILVRENGTFVIVDPNVKFRQPILDISEFLCSPGVNLFPAAWERLVESYWNSVASKLGEIDGIDVLLRRICGIFGGFNIRSEAQKESLGVFYRGVINESTKRIGKLRDTQRFFPDVYEEWMNHRPSFRAVYDQTKENTREAFNAILKKPKEYNISDEEIEDFEESKKLLFDEGLIEPEDLKNKPSFTNLKHDSAPEETKSPSAG